jgi:hypothetical protein
MRQPLTRALLEKRALLDYKAVEGRIIRFTGNIECFRDGEDCGPVAVKDALLYVVPGNMYDIRRWMDDVSLDPTWVVTFHPSPPPQFANDTSWFVYAPSYTLDKEAPVDYVDYELADAVVPTGIFLVVGFYAQDGQRFAEEFEAVSASAAEDAALRKNPELTVVDAIRLMTTESLVSNLDRTMVTTRDDLPPEKTCNHEPSWATVTEADGVPGVFDVCCSKCGLSGAFRVTEEQVDW